MTLEFPVGWKQATPCRNVLVFAPCTVGPRCSSGLMLACPWAMSKSGLVRKTFWICPCEITCVSEAFHGFVNGCWFHTCLSFHLFRDVSLKDHWSLRSCHLRKGELAEFKTCIFNSDVEGLRQMASDFSAAHAIYYAKFLILLANIYYLT